MKNFTTSDTTEPGVTMFDPLTELLRNGARQLIAQAVEAKALRSFWTHTPNTCFPMAVGL